jgi:uncharacterized protein YdhG (YjbR/CyaY superfamily)
MQPPTAIEVSMARTDFKSVDEYLATQPEATRAVLERVRAVIRKAVPKADEVISYQIPAYKLAGAAVIFFAGWKEHFSLYPASELVVETFKDELEPYEVKKGTIRFPLDQRVPVKLIAGIAKLRAKETAERVKAKRPTPKKVAPRAKAAIRK